MLWGVLQSTSQKDATDATKPALYDDAWVSFCNLIGRGLLHAAVENEAFERPDRVGAVPVSVCKSDRIGEAVLFDVLPHLGQINCILIPD